MAEEAKKVEETKPAEDKKVQPAPKFYKVTSLVRRVTTRTLRATSPTRHRFKIYIGGQRLLRNKSLLFTEAQFKKYEKEISALATEGKVIALSPDGEQLYPKKVAATPKKKAEPKKAEKEKPKEAEAPMKEAHEEAPAKSEAPVAKDDPPAEEAKGEPKAAPAKKVSSKKRGK
jgi:septum formation inhibitor MinC